VPVFRDENGNIVESPAGEVRRKSTAVNRGTGGKTRAVSGNLPPVHGGETSKPSKASTGSDKTQKYSPSGGATPKPTASSDSGSPKTRLVKGTSTTKPEDVSPSPSADDPVVGWVVIKSGAGQGGSFEIGYGSNDIGRSSESRIKLDFGDKSISRSTHCSIVYDPKGRTFYIQPGTGKNLTYLKGSPVLSSEKITSHDEISLGNTELIFVSLCGESFDWQDEE